MRVVAATAGGVFLVDSDEETVEASIEPFPALPDAAPVGLPRLVSAASCGSTIVAVVDTKPPLAISHDAGRTWRESGRGLPPGRAVAIAEDDPDLIIFAARNRLYMSEDGGRFWRGLAVELPEITGVRVLSATD